MLYHEPMLSSPATVTTPIKKQMGVKGSLGVLSKNHCACHLHWTPGKVQVAGMCAHLHN